MRYDPTSCYLGPAAWPLWLRCRIPYSEKFSNAAAFHDWAYENMGDEWGRRWADLEFFELMLEECETLPQAFFAFLYFALVRTFWWAFFEWKIHKTSPYQYHSSKYQ